ncbi:hypothetical protein RR46_06490 [Papilio xuthus]|uniref:Uncharacterized protein n=1 Tax=Papilio xuthus TaxID=66420 RepID=A0A194QD37_PAPXU|nr:hypothetical protein RR46_06490 [Papilio xuthus]
MCALNVLKNLIATRFATRVYCAAAGGDIKVRGAFEVSGSDAVATTRSLSEWRCMQRALLIYRPRPQRGAAAAAARRESGVLAESDALNYNEYYELEITAGVATGPSRPTMI